MIVESKLFKDKEMFDGVPLETWLNSFAPIHPATWTYRDLIIRNVGKQFLAIFIYEHS